MKRTVLGGAGIGLLVTLLWVPLFAHRAFQGLSASAAPCAESGTALREAVEEMRRVVEPVAPEDKAGEYFVSAMIPYYEAGIGLARKAASFSGDRYVARIAWQNALGEKLFLADMQRWRKKALPSGGRLEASSAGSFIRLMKEVKETTWQDIGPALNDKDPARSFITVMIAYGQGAADMAKVVLIFEGDRTLREIASRMIGFQQAEINTMQSWLTDR